MSYVPRFLKLTLWFMYSFVRILTIHPPILSPLGELALKTPTHAFTCTSPSKVSHAIISQAKAPRRAGHGSQTQ
ncbi:uncharacterized protein J3D65DRAFT_626512 [Phyllosticta citribraziliensis]|uniref:Secreted protein n=1 Tax=Phyllosticta citribraziliensis TaxID=989973 RepID=A0ABR1LMC8_9PEZI